MTALGFDRTYAAKLRERHGIDFPRTALGYSEPDARAALRDVLRPYLEALATDSTAPVAATTTTTAPVAATKPAAHGAKANPPHSGQAITEDQLARMSGREAAAFFKRGGRVA